MREGKGSVKDMGKHGLPQSSVKEPQEGKGEIRCVGGGGNNPPPLPEPGARYKIQLSATVE